MANRHQKRRHATLFRRSKIASYPRDDKTVHQKPGESLLDFLARLQVDVPVTGPMPCDFPGCNNEWHFSTQAVVGGKRKVVARRCAEHRLSQLAPAEVD